MSTGTFTPGPWRTERFGKEIEISALTAKGRLSVAWVHMGYERDSALDEARETDARFIASAPELYGALTCWPLTELLGMVEDSGNPKMWQMAQLFMEVQREALAKATKEPK